MKKKQGKERNSCLNAPFRYQNHGGMRSENTKKQGRKKICNEYHLDTIISNHRIHNTNDGNQQDTK
jgi:hypothetical protein